MKKWLKGWLTWSEDRETRERAGHRSLGVELAHSKVLVPALVLLLLGLVMVGSASMPIGEHKFGDPFYYLIRQFLFAGLGIVAVAVVVRIPIQVWEKIGPTLLLISGVLLALVLIPSIGHEVNGSLRWLSFGGFSLQPSEFAKLAALFYLAGYLVRHQEKVIHDLFAVMRPLVLLAIISTLILVEPDLGAALVLMAVVVVLMFLGGVKLWQFALFILAGIGAVLVAIWLEPFRMERVFAFFSEDPFLDDPNGRNYQITQALIAYGRGGWGGMGLGESVQKLFYLPEAHTDFLFAIIAEELGLIGAVAVVGLFSWLVWRIFQVAQQAAKCEQPFAAYLAYGLGLWIALQAFINLAVNMRLLPTKGLTLPLMSYGGSSLLVMMVVIALVMRIEFELCAHVRRGGNRSNDAPEKRGRKWNGS